MEKPDFEKLAASIWDKKYKMLDKEVFKGERQSFTNDCVEVCEKLWTEHVEPLQTTKLYKTNQGLIEGNNELKQQNIELQVENKRLREALEQVLSEIVYVNKINEARAEGKNWSNEIKLIQQALNQPNKV